MEFTFEVDFEWGSTATGADAALAQQSDMTRNLAAGAHKWRQLLHERRRLLPGVDHGAFIEGDFHGQGDNVENNISN
jgi:hypothetical protein